MAFYNQYGGMKCSLCGSEGTKMTNCPMNPSAKYPDAEKHPLAKGRKKKVLPEKPKELVPTYRKAEIVGTSVRAPPMPQKGGRYDDYQVGGYYC